MFSTLSPVPSPAGPSRSPSSVSISSPPAVPSSPTSPTRAAAAHPRTQPGDVLSPSTSSRFVLVKTLGRGAFSAVWLARDESEHPEGRRKSECAAPRKGERVHGLRPKEKEREGSVFLSTGDEQRESEDRLVAVKIMDRALCDANDRTRVAFVREVEVLRHISHPSIIAYKHAFSTTRTHCLVLSYAAGGELFEIVSDDQRWQQFRSYRADADPSQSAKGDGALLKRVFGELASAVAWMHSVHVVHRDIKLENILLTQALPTNGESLPPPTTALVKLADFGLARFIDPAFPRLTTRCGSEAYAAPELLVSGSRYRGKADDFDADSITTGARLPTYVRTFDGSSDSRSSDESSGPGTPPALWGLSDERAHERERVYTSSSIGTGTGNGNGNGGESKSPLPPKVLLEPATPHLGSSPAQSESTVASDLLSPTSRPSPSTTHTSTTHNSVSVSVIGRTSSRLDQPEPVNDAEREGYDPRLTDAWALGVVLYALTTRALPFGAAESSRDRRRAAAAQYGYDEGELAGWWEVECVEKAKEVVARLLVREPMLRASVREVEEWR